MTLEDFNKKWIVPLIAILSAIGAFFYTQLDHQIKYEASKIDTLKKSLDVASEQLDMYIKREQFDRDLKFKLFEEVRNALATNNARQQKVLLILIDEMLANDSALRNKYINILENSEEKAVRDEVKEIRETERKFYAQEAAKSIQVHSPQSKYTVDVFYLEENKNETYDVAVSAGKKLQATGKYNVRLRTLPRAVNAQSGYLISANEIRVEENEFETGRDVAQVISESFPVEKPRFRKVMNETPGYISVFVNNK